MEYSNLCCTMACFYMISISLISLYMREHTSLLHTSRPVVEITPVLTTFCEYYPCVHYFYVPCLIMTSQWVMTLLGMPHCGTTMGINVARDIHYDVTMDNDDAICT